MPRLAGLFARATIRLSIISAFLVFSVFSNIALLASDAVYDAVRSVLTRIVATVVDIPAHQSRRALQTDVRTLHQNLDTSEASVRRLDHDLDMARVRATALADQLDEVTVENRRLKSEIAGTADELTRSRALRSQAVAITDRMATRTARSITANFTSMVAEAAPYVGATVVVGVTFYEVRDACLSMRDMRELSGLLDGTDIGDIPACGYDMSDFLTSVFPSADKIDCTVPSLPPEMIEICEAPPPLDPPGETTSTEPPGPSPL